MHSLKTFSGREPFLPVRELKMNSARQARPRGSVFSGALITAATLLLDSCFSRTFVAINRTPTLVSVYASIWAQNDRFRLKNLLLAWYRNHCNPIGLA